MPSHEEGLAMPKVAPVRSGQYAIVAGRIGLAAALLGAWKLGADVAGPLYAADPRSPSTLSQ